MGAAILSYFAIALIGAIAVKSGGATGSTTGLAVPKPDELVQVLLISSPIHYDFLLPLNDVTRQEFGFLGAAGLALDHPQAQWLSIGWGAREFYTTTGTYGDLQAGAILKALFGDRSVMRVDLAGGLPDQATTRQLSLAPAHYRALLSAISSSFARDDQGQVVVLDAAGFSATDRFFQAHGRFDLLRTCNVWIGQMLRAADLRFGWWTPTPYAVTLSHWLYQ